MFHLPVRTLQVSPGVLRCGRTTYLTLPSYLSSLCLPSALRLLSARPYAASSCCRCIARALDTRSFVIDGHHYHSNPFPSSSARSVFFSPTHLTHPITTHHRARHFASLIERELTPWINNSTGMSDRRPPPSNATRPPTTLHPLPRVCGVLTTDGQIRRQTEPL